MTKIIDLLNQSPYDFYFLNVDPFLNLEIPELKNFVSLSPQFLKIKLDQKNSGKFLSQPAVIEYISSHSAATRRTPAIIPFKPSAKVETICQQMKWKLIAVNASTNRLLEDKLKFTSLLQQYSLPQVPNQILPLSLKSFQFAQNEFGLPLIVQTHFGWAGNSSYLVNKYDDLASKIIEGTPVKFSPYLSGYSLINNAVVYNGQLIQSPPGLQYTGLKPLTTNPLATVGRQWPSFANPAVIDQVRHLTNDFYQKILVPKQYQGYFGLDFLVYNNNVFILECNPRLTASFSFYYQLEKHFANINPLLLLHIAEFVNVSTTEFDHFNLPIIGSELTRKDPTGTTISKKSFSKALTTQTNPIILETEIIDTVC